MKKLKISIVLVAAAALFLVSGCSARAAATPDEFQKQAEGAGFTVTEQTAESAAGMTKDLSASKSDSTSKLKFMTFNSDSDAQNWYVARTTALASGKTAIDSDNYNKYTLTNGELYYAVIRVGETVLDCQTTTTSQKEVDGIIRSLHY